MDNVKFIEYTDPLTGDITHHAIIDRGNGEFTSMTKAHYEAKLAQQVEHLTENVPTNE